MTVTDPIPVEVPYGVADWKDYKHNWREVDAEFLQSRAILRFADATQRDAKLTSPQVGQVIYNNATDTLEFRSKTNAWVPYRPQPANLLTTTDTSALVKLSHSAAVGKGMSFTPTAISTDLPMYINGGTLTADATGVSIKTGARTALLTTDADSLVSNTKLKVPSIEFTGTGTVITATGKTVAVGTLTASSVSTGVISTTGDISAATGTIGGVTLSGTWATVGGVASGTGRLYGDASGAVLRRYTSAYSPAYVQVQETTVNLAGTWVDLMGTPRVMSKGAIQYLNAANDAVLGYGGPVIYSSGNLVATDYPNGTIWVSP